MVSHELPGEFTHGNPPPAAYLLAIDRPAGSTEILADASSYGCVSAGANGVVIATEYHYRSSTGIGTYDGSSQLLMFRDGVRQALEGACRWLSPPGDRTASWFSADDGSPQIVVADLDGETIQVATNRGGSPQWSSDGSLLAAIDGTTVWVMDVEGGEVNTVEFPEEADRLEFSGDGQRVAVVRGCEVPATEEYGDEIWIYETDGLRQLRHEPCAEQRFAQLTPDGDAYALRRAEDGIDGFRVVSVDDGYPPSDFVAGIPLAFRPDR